jgi:hypothetical protein
VWYDEASTTPRVDQIDVNPTRIWVRKQFYASVAILLNCREMVASFIFYVLGISRAYPDFIELPPNQG